MSDIFNSTMSGLESSSERYATSFQASHDEVNEGTSGTAPMISQQDQIASVSYRPGDVAKPASTVGEVSIAIPIMTPTGTLGFQNWAVNGWDGEGKTLTNTGLDDYKHEPQMKNTYWGAGNTGKYVRSSDENRQADSQMTPQKSSK